MGKAARKAIRIETSLDCFDAGVFWSLASAAASDPLPLKPPIPSPNPLTRDETPAAPAPSPRTVGDRSQREKKLRRRRSNRLRRTAPMRYRDSLRKSRLPVPQLAKKRHPSPTRMRRSRRNSPGSFRHLGSSHRLPKKPPAASGLRRWGPSSAEQPPVSDPNGCAMPRPISLSALGSGIGCQPPALVNCATAEALARFLTGTGVENRERRDSARR